MTRVDRTVQELRHAQVIRDSLVGYARPAGTGDSLRVAMALAEVRRVEARGRTAVTAIGAFVGVLFAVLVAITIATGGL